MCSKTWPGHTQAPKAPPTLALSPQEPHRPSSATPSAQCVLTAAPPPTSPWGCPCPRPFLGAAPRGAAGLPPPLPCMAPGHSLVTQDDPLNACPEEDDGADICQAVKENQEDTECLLAPCQWGARTPIPA